MSHSPIIIRQFSCLFSPAQCPYTVPLSADSSCFCGCRAASSMIPDARRQQRLCLMQPRTGKTWSVFIVFFSLSLSLSLFVKPHDTLEVLLVLTDQNSVFIHTFCLKNNDKNVSIYFNNISLFLILNPAPFPVYVEEVCFLRERTSARLTGRTM